MPDFDSGHIFLTTLAPIRDSAVGEHRHTSFTQAARIALAKLPTALQSPATEKIGINSPFSRNTRTHFARMFIINDVIFNGREGKNAISASLSGDDPALPKHVDRLNTSYLVFCAEIDAVTSDGETLPKELSPEKQRQVRDAYARELWATMEDELRDVYGNCQGFDGVDTADDFATYLNRCHVETTMPFHDYYTEAPAFHNLPWKGLLAAIALPFLYAALALLLWLFGAEHMPITGAGTGVSVLIGLALTGIAAFVAWKYTLANGEKPLPPGKYDDLPSVLKALYLQQKFADFAVDAQGLSDTELHDRFGAFLKEHQPGNREGPTQPPGVIRAPGQGGAEVSS